MVPKRSMVLFGDLCQFLVGLGFTQSKSGKFWRFEQVATGAIVRFRSYRPRERITALDLHRIRQDLDNLGLVNEEAFDDLLNRATA
jgi:hypothetical protein